MKKFLALSGIVAAVAMSAPAFAQDTNTSASVKAEGSLSTVHLTCLAIAVDAHEDAVTAAHTKFTTAVANAQSARRVSLAANFTIAVNHERGVAIQLTVKAYRDAVQKARMVLKTDLQAASSVMATAHAKCNIVIGGDTGSTVKVDADGRGRVKHDNSGKKEKSNNGRHLGQLKNMLKQDLDIGADVKSDLKFKF